MARTSRARYPSQIVSPAGSWSSWTMGSLAVSRVRSRVHRAGLALVLGNLALHCGACAARAGTRPSERPSRARRRLPRCLAWHGGRAEILEPAHQSYAAGRASLQRVGHYADALGSTIALADIRIAQGRLREAMRTYEQALRLAPEQGAPVLRGTADMHVGMSELHRERDDLPAATQQFLRSQELGEHSGLPQNRYRWRVAMARVREAEEIWTAHSTCSTRRNGCMWVISSPRATGPGVDGTGVGRAGRAG